MADAHGSGCVTLVENIPLCHSEQSEESLRIDI